MSAQIVTRSPLDRLRYTLMFEFTLIGIFAPLGAMVMEREALDLGLLVLALSAIAMLVNFIYNYFYDRIDVRHGRIPTERSLIGRIVHALIFELILTAASLPLIIWWLDIGWVEALLMDIALMIGVVFYTLIYTWIYDRLFPLIQPVASYNH